MAISVNWGTKVINIPQADLTFVSGSLYELDVDVLRLRLKDLEDDEAGIPFPRTHNHNTTVTVSGITLARVVEIINGYTITFQDGQYAVRLVGANNNIADVMNINQVSLRSQNSTGLSVPGITKTDQFDGRAFEDLLVDLLTMASGRIVESPAGTFTFYKRDNSTVRYTLVKSGSERQRT